MLELPPDHVGPLVQEHGQVPMGADPLGEGRVHNSLTCWSDGDWLLKLALSTLGDPSNLSCEALHVFLLLVEGFLSDKDWEVAILHANLLESHIHESLDLLPDIEGEGSEDVAAGDVIVLDHVGLGDDLLVPF